MHSISITDTLLLHQFRKWCIRLLSLSLLVFGYDVSAQCTDWGIKASLTASSTCAASGSFSVSLYGSDAGNLSNVQYAIPLTASGFSVPLNNSSSFVNIPPGTYTVTAIADCGTQRIGRNATITIPGSYKPPVVFATEARTTLSCGAYGKINVSVKDGAAPFTIRLLTKPAAYTGPSTFSASASNYTINNLNAGIYTIQVTDACGSGTNIATVGITTVLFNSMPLVFTDPYSTHCDTICLPKPVVNANIPGWYNYDADNLFQVSTEVSNGLLSPTAFEDMFSPAFKVKLAAGKTLKDYYGKTITHTIKPPCGSNRTVTQVIPYPSVSTGIEQNCNANFIAQFSFKGAICYPVTYTITNSSGTTSYGPYTTSSASAASPALPIGSYNLTYTTADGYTGTGSFATSSITGNPYSVTIINSGSGLHQYIDGFLFSTSAAFTGIKTVELFNGPAGYSYKWMWTNWNLYSVTDNMTPSTGTLKFKAGTYVWKITDNCGTYYLSIIVKPQELYSYSAGIAAQQEVCSGLRIWPSATGSVNGNPVPVTVSLLKDGYPYTPTPGPSWPRYSPGIPLLITEPGTYTLVPSAATSTLFLDNIGYPNPYTSTFTFTYNRHPVQANISKTSGFACNNATTGQGKIFIEGRDGMPYLSGGAHYQYQLALAGNGLTGPYIAGNTTGAFSGFGGNANDVFDIKITDSCGAFAVQQVKILDLQHSRLISSTGYAVCDSEDVHLQALYIPGAVYSWTGPNGFTSSLRDPVITKMTPAKEGVYKLVITTSLCTQLIADSIMVTLNHPPNKPLISVTCFGNPTSLTVTNPSAALKYTWKINIAIGSFTYSIEQPSDIAYTKYVPVTGGYRVVAIDTLTQCSAESDSVYFGANPNVPLVAAIYSPHLKLCSGDTTILVAMGTTHTALYQWFKDGLLIPGATSSTYITSVPGKYKVSIDAGPCVKDTSDEVTVSVVSRPSASLTTSKTDICEGETAILQANTGAGYTYTWYYNGNTIPGANNASYNVTTSGVYSFIVSNDGCIATSPSMTIDVHNKAAVNLIPVADQFICIRDTILMSTIADAAYSYTWYKDGNILPGQTTASLKAYTGGLYRVGVRTAYCPDSISASLRVTVLPSSLYIGNDTTICTTGSFMLPLSVPDGFDDVQWSDGSTMQQTLVTKAGKYWVKCTNKCGTVTDTMYVYTLQDYMPGLPDDTVICNEAGIARLTVPRLLQNVRWSTGYTGSTLQVTEPGMYRVEGESPCGIISDSILVSFCRPTVRDIVLSADTICEGGCIRLRPIVENFPQQYYWYFEGGNPSAAHVADPPDVCYAIPGTYSIMLAVSSKGGSDTFHTAINVLPRPVPAFTDTSFVVPYKSLLSLPAPASAQSVRWYLNDSLVCEGCDPLDIDARLWRAVYKCVVSNGDCDASARYTVSTTGIPTDIWLPGAFTPNGDGLNDLFRIITDNPNVDILQLSVYNRFGEQVYNGKQGDRGWDGTYKGKRVEMGTYFWQIKYKVKGTDGEYYLKGDITVL